MIHDLKSSHEISPESNISPSKTAIHRTKPSRPVQYLLSKNLIPHNGSILDFGCGIGFDVQYLKKKGFRINGYDPHLEFGFPDNVLIEEPSYKFVMMNYVINVIPNNEYRIKALDRAWKQVSKNGHLWISARSNKEIDKLAIKSNWLKHKDGFITKRGTFQKGFDEITLKITIEKLENKSRFEINKVNDFYYALILKN